MTTPPNITSTADAPVTSVAENTMPTAAGIAETVGAVLAQAATAAGPEHASDAAEIQSITNAMVRLLVGVPMRSDGQLTVKSLAEEAGLRRNKLTHKHIGLKDLFYALVRTQDARPKVADDLKRHNDELKKQLAGLRGERDQLRTDVRQLVRVVHVLEVENHQLRQSAGADGVVRVLPTQLRAPAGVRISPHLEAGE